MMIGAKVIFLEWANLSNYNICKNRFQLAISLFFTCNSMPKNCVSQSSFVNGPCKASFSFIFVFSNKQINVKNVLTVPIRTNNIWNTSLLQTRAPALVSALYTVIVRFGLLKCRLLEQCENIIAILFRNFSYLLLVELKRMG